MSEEERRDLIDEEQGDDVEAHRRATDDGDDVEAHRKHGGAGMTDDGDDADDVEAHRKHGGA